MKNKIEGETVYSNKKIVRDDKYLKENFDEYVSITGKDNSGKEVHNFIGVIKQGKERKVKEKEEL